MDKDNQFSSCSFHMDTGDVLHILVKDLTGAGFVVGLNDAEGNSEAETEISSYGEYTDIEYGALYNWPAVVDARNIANNGWHVPTVAEYDTLISYLGGGIVAGGKLKEEGITHWSTPNTDATNEVGFNARGAGYRNGADGVFYELTESKWCWTSTVHDATHSVSKVFSYNDGLVTVSNPLIQAGETVRLIKDSTTLTHGQTGTYTGNDGKVYRTIAIGAPAQEWLAYNLAETKYRNGDSIPVVTDTVAWAALVTDAMCYYDNNPSYA